jgi:hypothetical protein
MEEFMKYEVQELIEKANQITKKSGSGPGVKYPNSLKKIIISLRNEHDLSIKDVVRAIPISAFSAREWPRQATQNNFTEVKIKKNTSISKPIVTRKHYKNSKEINAVLFNQKILIILITLLIFQPLVLHLFD